MLGNGERYIRFSIAIEHMAKTLQKYKNEKLNEYGLRSMHLMFLFRLNQAEEGMTGSELAVSCSVDKAFISRVTNELCSAGYVEYKNKGGSRYKNKLVLTQAGKKVMEHINSMIDEAISSATEGITETQLNIFYSVLGTIDKNLESVSEKNVTADYPE